MAKNKLEIQYRSENLNYWMFTFGMYETRESTQIYNSCFEI